MSNRDFIICIGAEKAGTTTLYSLFQEHPEVVVSLEKETGFFYNDELFEKGLNWYIGNFFPDIDEQGCMFEADPNYCYFDKCLRRLRQCIPNARIIFILRHPVERAFSQYLMMKKWGLELLDFEQACAVEPTRILKGDWQKGHFGYVDRSDYLPQVKKILSIFPRNQVYFIEFNTFIKNQQLEYNKLLKWLGLNSCETYVEKHANKSSSPRIKFLSQLIHHPRYRKSRQWIARLIGQKGALRVKAALEKVLHTNKKSEKVSPEFYHYLWQRFAKDVKEIEVLTGLDLSSWERGCK